jgi:hypothetical protein
VAVVNGLGINANYQGAGSDLTNDIPMLARLGFKTLRLLVVGYTSQTQINQWNAWLDIALAQSEFERIIIGVGPGSQTMDTTKWTTFSGVVDTQAAYLAGVGDSRIEYQIGNEMELHYDGVTISNAAAVRTALRADAARVKGNHPGLTLSYASSVFAGDEVTSWASEGLGSFDRMGFNLYHTRLSFQRRLDEIRTLLPNTGYVTEWGTTSGFSTFNNENRFRDEIAARLEMLKRSGLATFIYYGFQENENRWGAKTTDGHFREVWPLLIGAGGITQ